MEGREDSFLKCCSGLFMLPGSRWEQWQDLCGLVVEVIEHLVSKVVVHVSCVLGIGQGILGFRQNFQMKIMK